MARSFNGISDLINCGVCPSNLQITTKISFSAWVNPSAAPATNTQAAILLNGANPRNFAFDWRDNSGTKSLESSWTVSGVFAEEKLTNTLAINTWTHIAFTCDYSTNPYVATWYVNGVGSTASNSGAATSGTPDSSAGGQNLIIGAAAITPSALWAGNLADIAVWNGVILSAGEILALSLGARPFSIRPTALNGYWSLTGLQSPEPDLSGFKNNGTLTGTAQANSGPPTMAFTSRWPQRAQDTTPVSTIILPGQFSTSFAQRVSAVGY